MCRITSPLSCFPQGSTAFSNLPLTFVTAALVFCYALVAVTRQRKLSSFVTVNPSGFCDIFSSKAQQQWITNGEGLIRKGFAKNANAFRVQTDFAQVLVLSPNFADELRNEDRLSSGKFTETELMGSIPGFEPFAFAGSQGRKLVHDVITLRLNRALPTMADFLSLEAAECLEKTWTDKTDWHDIPLYQMILRLVAQASIRVFLGPELCRHERWIEINMQYAMVAITAVKDLRKYPRSLVSLFHWFHPGTRNTRALIAEARSILTPIYQKKTRELATLHNEERKSGEKAQPATDALGWFEEVAKGQVYDPTVAQLTFSVAALHATTDLLCQLVLDLAQRPEVVNALRKELVEVLSKEGWRQSAFSQLRVMDSVMKESQRLKPVSRVFNKRVATDDIELQASGGIRIPKGTYVAVSAHNMRDESIYAQPEEFDAYRFINRAKDPELAKSCGFTAATPEHMAFGFGKTACPGRVYVALELKIILAHILMKYDFRLPDGKIPTIFNNGFDTITDVMAQLEIRRRKEEVNLPA